jgi:hypothetical protein
MVFVRGFALVADHKGNGISQMCVYIFGYINLDPRALFRLFGINIRDLSIGLGLCAPLHSGFRPLGIYGVELIIPIRDLCSGFGENCAKTISVALRRTSKRPRIAAFLTEISSIIS